MTDTVEYGSEFVTWRPGVETRMRVSAENGARSLCVFDQRIAPTAGAPMHTHTVEEVLHVQSGSALITVGERSLSATAGDMVLIPAGVPHGFVNVGDNTLTVSAILAAPIFEAMFGDAQFVRRWSIADKGATDVRSLK